VTGRPAYHPATLLKIYLYGYLNRIQSSRRLERETQRNIELMWLTGRLMPDFKTIADFRRDSGPALRAACAQFVVLCRQSNLFTRTIVAIDGSKFKAVKVGAAKDYEAKYSIDGLSLLQLFPAFRHAIQKGAGFTVEKLNVPRKKSTG
jgi:Transposase domain (DUF772)